MATFRSVLSRWIFLVVVFLGSFTFMGAAFAPLSPSFQAPFGSTCLGPSVGLKIVSDPIEPKSFHRHDAALSRLETLTLTYRAISVSA